MFNRLRLDLVITLSPLDLYIAPLTSPRSCRQSAVCYHRHARWTHAFLNAATMQSLLWVAAYGILISLFFIHRLIWAYTYIVEEGTFFYLVRSRLYWLLLCTTTNVSIDNRSIMTNNWWLTCNVPTMSAKSAGERTKTILNRCADGAIFWGMFFIQF